MPCAPVSSGDWDLPGRGCLWGQSRRVTAVPSSGMPQEDGSKSHPGHLDEGVLWHCYESKYFSFGKLIAFLKR